RPEDGVEVDANQKGHAGSPDSTNAGGSRKCREEEPTASKHRPGLPLDRVQRHFLLILEGRPMVRKAQFPGRFPPVAVSRTAAFVTMIPCSDALRAPSFRRTDF